MKEIENRDGANSNEDERGQSNCRTLGVGILAKMYPRKQIRSILERSGLQSQRVRDLPIDALVYYIIALGLYMAVSTGEVLRSLV